jgi:hypothetical protein
VKMGGLLGFGVPQREFCAFNWGGGQR